MKQQIKKENQILFKFKIGKKKFKITKGKPIDVFYGMICGYIGFSISSLIGYYFNVYNKWFVYPFAFLFGIIFLYKFQKYWIKLTRGK